MDACRKDTEAPRNLLNRLNRLDGRAADSACETCSQI